MAVARTNIINFFSEEDFDKYFALHKEFASSLDECGLLEATYVKASATSLLYFSVVETEEGAQEREGRAGEAEGLAAPVRRVSERGVEYR